MDTGQVWDEVTYLAYHLHWGFDALIDLEHRDRARLLAAVARLNERAWEEVRELV